MTVPPIDGAGSDEYAQKVAGEGLVPEIRRELSNEAKGTLLRVDPEENTEVDAGSTVFVIVSAGAPLLAFDDDEDILVVDSGTGKKRDPIATGTAVEKDPAWSFDGTSVLFTSGDAGGGQVMLSNRERPDATPIALTPEGRKYSDLAWAPTLERNVVAMARRADPTIDLCLGVIRQREAMKVRCKEEPDFVIGRKISWAFDGKSLLAFGATNDLSEFGMIQWKTKKPFSPRSGRLVGRRVRHGHVAEEPRGHRRRPLARRRAPGGGRARRGRPLAALLREAGRLQADGRRAAGRARLQGDLAARRAGARGRAGRRLLRLEHG